MAYSPNNISQQDPKWKNEKLGFSNSKIGPYGCALTCLSILAKGFGKNETPATLNQKLKALGRGNGFIDDLVVWGGLPVIYPELSLRKLTICRQDSQRAPLDEIDAALTRGQAVLVELDRSPAQGIQNHWVVLYKKEGNDYLMNDPWPYPVDQGNTKLAERYAAGRSLAKIITAVVWYEMADTAPPLDDGFYVQVLQSASSGLRLRAQPTVASATLALESAGAYLRVVEKEADARAKIGVTGEWLHVRNLLGTEGYVAAWFVQAIEQTNTDPEDTPTDDPDDTPVDPPVDDPVDTPNDDPIDEPNDEIPAETLKFYVSKIVGERGLRMRSQAGLGGSLVTTLSQSAELTTLEDAASARAKVGVDEAWLHVKMGAHEGYVAAWLITLDPNEVLEEEPVKPVDEPVDTPDETPEGTPVEQPKPPAVETPGLKIYILPEVGTRGLRMRAQPSLGGTLVTTLSQATELTSLEDADVTHSKVGVDGKWLRVKDGAQHEGYVAAWLVSLKREEQPSGDTSSNEPVNDPNDKPVDEPPVTNNNTPNNEPVPSVLSVTVLPSLGRNGLRMRSSPDLGGSLISVLPGSTPLTVLENPVFAEPKVGVYSQWLHVRTLQGVEGYVAAWYVKLDQNIVNTSPPQNLIVYVSPLARGGLRMRKGPSTGYSNIKTIKANSVLTVLENEEEAIAKIGATGEWLHVKDENEVEGYVAAWYILR